MNNGLIAFTCLLGSLVVSAEPARVDSVRVGTKAPSNPSVAVYYRVPAGYDARSATSYRVLVLFGGRNDTEERSLKMIRTWGEWADRCGVFIVSPGFKDDEYWQPQKWSGQALRDALGQIKRNYRICDTKLLYYGYSAGSQCANLFAAWQPDRARAWVSHGCGVFHEPSVQMQGVPGLVTCGDADRLRYVIGRRFWDKCRAVGVNLIWRSFPNSPHDVPPDSLKLARAFLEYYHLLCIQDLKSGFAGRVPTESYPFVGDDQEGIYYPSGSIGAKNIPPEDCVFFPCREIAEAWKR